MIKLDSRNIQVYIMFMVEVFISNNKGKGLCY